MSATLPPAPPITAAQVREAAAARLAAGDVSGAIDGYVQGLALDPAHRHEADRLALVLGDIGRLEQANRLIEALDEARLILYQRRVVTLRASPYLDYPRHVHLETLARCNARCDFCPSPELARTGARLPDALIEKVLSDLQDIPADVPFQLSPYKVNEPFLDVRLFDILDAIEARLPGARIALTTNGSALTDKKLRRLAGRAALGDLYVSFNDHRPEAYERTMALSYERTAARLDRLHAVVQSGELDVRVTLSRVGDGSVVDDQFRVAASARWPAFGTLVMRRGDWLGQVETPIAAVPDVGCIRWFELSITATGQVAHCCMDGQAQWPIGDVAGMHALDVYNQPEYRALRAEALTRRAASPCNTCTFF